ncbi:MAG: inorganic phosphate transporter, partial [Mycobacteriaceae bacterium]
SSSSHALVGGLVGAGVVTGGVGAVRWGGLNGWRPAGVGGVLAALALSALLGGLAGWMGEYAVRRAVRRAQRRVTLPILRGEWLTSSALAFAHGTNDAQKTTGVITFGAGSHGGTSIVRGAALGQAGVRDRATTGTALGGWRIVRTLGRGIYRIRPLDGLVSQAASGLIVGGAAAFGAPVSTTHVVASSVVGVGPERRWRHVPVGGGP